jgi:indolepyruvate ferredoxin oxidoreductase
MLIGIDRVTRKDANVYLDAAAMAEGLFDDHMATNSILMGAAYQAGALAISAESIEQAIRLNGVSVEMNLLAFRWGRMAVVDAKYVDGALRRVTGKLTEALRLSTVARQIVDSVGATGELLRLLEIRVPDLIEYQSVAYARLYADFVARVAREEQRRTPGRHGLNEAVARHLYKLMAYKDEYEVARLHLSAALQAETQSKFGSRIKLYWHLHPPLLRALGVKKKIKLGSWFTPAFTMLRALKALRGTALDPFGYAEVRRTERQLIGEYRGMIEAVLIKLTPANHHAAVAVAELPDEIRGYERIKLDNVKRFRDKASQLLSQLT